MAAERAERTDVRATDHNRTSVADALDSALASGQLDRFEHHERVRAATRATYVSELRPLLADLQGVSAELPGEGTPRGRGSGRSASSSSTIQGDTDGGPGTAGRSRALVVIPVLLLLAVGAAVYVLTSRDDGAGPGPSAGAPGAAVEQVQDAPAEARVLSNPSPLTLEGLRQVFGTAAAANGSGVATRITAHPEHAGMEWIDPEHPSQTLSATYRGGWDTPDDRPTTADQSFRLADLNAEMLAPLIAGAPETLGVPDGRPSHIIIEADDAGMPTYSVYASNDVHQSGYFRVDHAGEPLRMHPAS